jgi:carbonic anhydrase
MAFGAPSLGTGLQDIALARIGQEGAERFSNLSAVRGLKASPAPLLPEGRAALSPVKPSHVAGINDVVYTWPPMTSEFPARLIEGYRDFLAGRMATERERYRELARRGQSPTVMVIGCCDSRVSPEVIFDTHPGELFVVRNIANLVPACTPDGVCHGVFAALEFAVQVLKVRHIVVLGHARCGGIRAFVEGGPPLSPGDSIHKWMSLIAPAVELAGPPEADGDYLARLEQASIAMSLDNR